MGYTNAEEPFPDSLLGSTPFKDYQCIHTLTVAAVSYVQSCLCRLPQSTVRRMLQEDLKNMSLLQGVATEG